MALENELERIKDIMSQITDKLGITDLLSDKKQTSSPTDIKSHIVGSSWKSCSAYRSKGGLSFYKDKIKIDKSPSHFSISYSGPAAGLSIAHASGGKDTIHQLYNVLICEINPYLAQGKMKPNIDGITTKTSDSKGDSKLTIDVPLQSSTDVWQLDRRGGWGHDPGSTKMKDKCNKVKEHNGKCIGPVQNIALGKFGKITEYFITHTI